MSIARVFAHLIECSDRRIPFQTLQTLLSVKSFRALAQISLKKYLSSLSSLSTDLLQNSLKTLIQTSSIFNNICLVSEFLFRVSILLSQCWRKERFEISRCVELLVVVKLSISPGTAEVKSRSSEVCQRSASHLANLDTKSCSVNILTVIARNLTTMAVSEHVYIHVSR